MRLAFILLAALAMGDDKKPAIPEELRPAIELARASRPEFFADAILRLVSNGSIRDPDQQAGLLEDAFSAAAQAKEPLKLTTVPGTPPDTRELYRGKAAALALDALSLESRVVLAMMKLDSAKARGLFERIPRPRLEPRPCSDAMIPDASAYYDAAASVAQNAFTAREKESEAHLEFLNALLTSAQSPNEIAAFARAMQSVSFTREQSRYLLSSIAVKLELARPDYRPFAASLDALQSELWKLVQANPAARDEIVRSFRTYVINQLTAARCAPDLPLGLDQISWLHPRV